MTERPFIPDNPMDAEIKRLREENANLRDVLRLVLNDAPIKNTVAPVLKDEVVSNFFYAGCLIAETLQAIESEEQS